MKISCNVRSIFWNNIKDYSMCYHNAIKLNNETGEETLLNTFPEDGTYSQKEQILAGIRIEFSSVFFLCYENRVILEYARLF